jgi:DNA topoisomerase-3
LRRGRSQVLKGLKSKSGRAFDARLKLDQGKVRFDFES